MVTSLDQIVSLAVFAHVVEAKSFTAAAAQLHISKSVVSRRVADLEDRLGVRLLHRTTRQLTLTADGVRVYEQCAPVVRAAAHASEVADPAGAARGLLRVSAPVTFGELELPGVVRAILRDHPDVRLELLLTDRKVDLVAEGIDVAIRIASRLSDSNLVARKLGSDRKVLCGSPAYLRSRGVPATPSDLIQHDCLRFSRLSEKDEWTFLGPERVVVPVTGRLVCDDATVLRDAVLHGLGLAVMPLHVVAADLAAGRLSTVLEDYVLDVVDVYAVHTYVRHVPAKVRAFIDLVEARLRTLSWQTRRGRSS